MPSVSPQFGRLGVLYGIGAYGLWGLIPLYFKAVAHVAPLEVLAHRAMWSFLLLAVVVQVSRRWRELLREVGSRRVLAMLALSTVLISVNWLTFIYAVLTRQVLQASLGYFVTPLVNVLLGMVFLKERLRRVQAIAIAFAAVGVLIFATLVGEFPWIALTLALSFSFYALVRKTVPVDGLVSLTVETLAMTPAALAYLGWLTADAAATGNDARTLGILALGGVVTTVPLLMFGAAARRLRLATLGILQYLSPSLQFLLAVAVFRESFATAQLVSFALIWTAVGLYAFDSLRAARQRPVDLVEPFGVEQ